MAGTFDISTINVISPNGLVTKPLTVDDYGYAKIGDERVGVTPQNWIINGMFDVWQRGTSQTSSGYGSDDRWTNNNDISTKTHSQQTFAVGQTDVPNNPTYYSRTVVNSVVGSANLVRKNQTIEDVVKLSGKTISLSFWAKADANKNIAIEFVQDFGTGGSTQVNSIGIQKFALTTSWQRFTKIITLPSAVGKTIGAGNYTRLSFWFDAGSTYASRTDSLGNQSGTFDIANVCLVEGSVPVECPNEPYAEVLRKCQRYYWRISSDATSNEQFFSIFGFAHWGGGCLFEFKNPVEMRTSPTSFEYNNITHYDGQNSIAISGLVLNPAQSSKTISSCYSSGTGLTQYRPYFVKGTSSSSYVGASAEL